MDWQPRFSCASLRLPVPSSTPAANDMIELELKLEKFIPRRPGPIEEFADGVATVLSCAPAAAPAQLFGRAERMSNGLLDIGTGARADTFAGESGRRIKV